MMGPFVEVPYKLNSLWIAYAGSWAAIEGSGGMPAGVVRVLRPGTLEWARRVVSLWASVDAYAAAHDGRRVCPTGKAWIGPGPAGSVRFLVGMMDPPHEIGPRRRWRW